MRQGTKFSKKRNRFMLFVVSLLVVFTYGSMSVFAADTDAVPDLSGGSYSLTVRIVSTNPDTSQTGIKGAEISIYQVASLEVKNAAANYIVTQEYMDFDVEFEDMSASESNDAAKRFANEIDKGGFSGQKQSGRTDNNGSATFDNLTPGIYLVRLDEYAGYDERYTAMEPFLVLVPGIDRSGADNRWIDHMVVTPKIAINPKDYIEVDPPVIKKVEGKDNATDEFVFELVADDITNPMPVGTVAGRKQITICGQGENDFGVWRYTEPGTYSYTIREIPGSDSNYHYDRTVYHLTDTVSYSGNQLKLEQTLIDEDGNTYDGRVIFEFKNKYSAPPSIPSIPRTGDKSPRPVWIIAGLALAVMITALATARRR